MTQEKKRDEEQIEIEPPEIEPPVDGNAETQGGADFTRGTQMTHSPNPSPNSDKEIGCSTSFSSCSSILGATADPVTRSGRISRFLFYLAEYDTSRK